MMEGKVLHNSPMADIQYNEMDRKMNKWLVNIAGLPINMTFLRCELGVLPSQLVAEPITCGISAKRRGSGTNYHRFSTWPPSPA